MDSITIQGLSFETGIGVYDWEKEILQRVVIDLCLYTNARKAGASDQLEDAIDYQAISTQIQQLLKDRHFQLIEAMANDIAAALLSNNNIESLSITIAKPGALRQADSVSISLNRNRSDYP